MKKFLLPLLLAISCFAQAQSIEEIIMHENTFFCIAEWKKGDERKYEYTSIKTEFRNDKLAKQNESRTIYSVKVLDSLPDGYLLNWRAEQVSIPDAPHFEEVPAIADIINMGKDVDVRIKTDDAGSFLGIANYEEYRDNMVASTLRMVDTLVKYNEMKPESVPFMKQFVEKTMADEANILYFTKQIHIFLSGYGYPLMLDTSFSFPSVVPVPIANAEIPADFHVSATDLYEDSYSFKVTVEIEKEEMRQKIYEVIKKMIEEYGEGIRKDKQLNLDDIPEMSFKMEYAYTFELETGFPLELIYNQRVEAYVGDTSVAKVEYHRFSTGLTIDKPLEEMDYDYLIEQNPDVPYYYEKRAMLRLQQGDFEGAAKDFTMVLNVDPTSLISYYDRAEAYMGMGEIEKAIDDFEILIDHMGDDFGFNYQLIYTYKVAGEKEKALQTLEKVLKQDESNHDTYLLMAEVKAYFNDTTGAIQALEEAAKLAPRDEFLWVSSAYTYAHLGNLEKTTQSMHQLIAINGGNVNIAGLQATIYLMKQRNADAQKRYEAVMAGPIDNISIDLKEYIAYSSLINEEYDVCPDLCDALTYAEPNIYSWAYSYKGYSLYKLGKTEEGLALIEKGLDIDPLDGRVLYYKAEILHSQGKKKEACSLATKALTLKYTWQFKTQAEKLLEGCR